MLLVGRLLVQVRLIEKFGKNCVLFDMLCKNKCQLSVKDYACIQ